MRQTAVVVKEDDLFLVLTVVRAGTADVYVNWPRDHVSGWKPHTSYHASGQHHQKSFDRKLDVKREQKPDAAFKGTVCVVSTPIAASEHKDLNIRCKAEDFDDVFEIDANALSAEKYEMLISVDLVEPGVAPALVPGCRVVQQETFRDAEPWIVISVIESK